MITQQKNKVTGSVVDEMGPVAGASISVKGTSNGTITDQDGRFVLDGVQKGAVLVISFVGMATQQITWDGHSAVNVKLLSDTQDLDEVVVVAYGTAKKSSFTGFCLNSQIRPVGKDFRGRFFGSFARYVGRCECL